MTQRVTITEKAAELVRQLQARFGDLMFHQSGGCCDGSQPMCFEKGEFKLGASDVCLGMIESCEFWMNQDQFELWKYTQLCIDITSGRGSSFSLEIPTGYRFITKSRIYAEDELNQLAPLTYLD